MQISHEEILFTFQQTSREIHLTNSSESVLIFKIKTNYIVDLKANPSRGFIDKKETKSINIQCTIKEPKFQAKLQINWAPVKAKHDNFQDAWKKVPSDSFSQKIILMSRKQQQALSKNTHGRNGKQIEDKSDGSQSVKSSSMSEYNNLFNTNTQTIEEDNNKMTMSNNNQSFKLESSVTNPIKKAYSKTFQTNHNGFNFNERQKPEKRQIKITQTRTLKAQTKSNGLFNKTDGLVGKQSLSEMPSQNVNFLRNNSHRSSLVMEQQNVYQSMRVNELSSLCFVQAQLLAQREQTARLKEELRRNTELERERDEMMRQYSISQSMMEGNSEGQSFSWSGAILLAVIFFVMGVLLSRF